MKRSIPVLALLSVTVLALGAKPGAPPVAADHDVYTTDTAALKARLEMRRLWSDHAALTHAYIMSATAELPNEEALARRVLENADEITNALAQYYSTATAARVSALLRQHVMLITDAVHMAKAKEKDEMGPVQDKLDGNGKELVSFLAGLNPNWNEAELGGMIEEHINHENDALMACVDHDWPGNINAWDDAQNDILKLADVLSLGLERQFPDRFAAAN
jgi:hypothetical protein